MLQSPVMNTQRECSSRFASVGNADEPVRKHLDEPSITLDDTAWLWEDPE